MNKGCSSRLINSSSNRHRVSLAEWLSSGFIRSGVRSGPGAARTILLLHINSTRPSKQPLIVRTFLKAYMDLGSYFLFLQEQIKDIIIILSCAEGGDQRPTSPDWGCIQEALDLVSSRQARDRQRRLDSSISDPWDHQKDALKQGPATKIWRSV